MNTDIERQEILRKFLEQVLDLEEYVESKFDTAPIPWEMGRYHGHVQHDTIFLEKSKFLFQEIADYMGEWGIEKKSDFKTAKDEFTHSVLPDHKPVHNGMMRCRCWWDKRDELRSVRKFISGLIKEIKDNANQISRTTTITAGEKSIVVGGNVTGDMVTGDDNEL